MGAGIDTFPWTALPKDLLIDGNFDIVRLRDYFKAERLKQGKTGACCNCGRIKCIQSSGLCASCYIASRGKTGSDLLNALTGIRAKFAPEFTSINPGEIGPVFGDSKQEKVDEENNFTPPKIIKKIQVTDPKYADPSVTERAKEKTLNDYDQGIIDGSESPESPKSEASCSNVFLVDDMTDPDEPNVIGPLDNPDVAVNAVLRSEAHAEIDMHEKSNMAEVVSDNHEVEVIKPMVKNSVVIELGDAEIEFRAGTDTVDIKVEDGGDLVFFARNIEKRALRTLATFFLIRGKI